mgnify:CR=1 FL=1
MDMKRGIDKGVVALMEALDKLAKPVKTPEEITQIASISANNDPEIGAIIGETPASIQNGLGAEEVVGAQGAWPLLSAVTFMSGVRHTDAHVEYELDTETWLGPFADTATILKEASKKHADEERSIAAIRGGTRWRMPTRSAAAPIATACCR